MAIATVDNATAVNIDILTQHIPFQTTLASFPHILNVRIAGIDCGDEILGALADVQIMVNPHVAPAEQHQARK